MRRHGQHRPSVNVAPSATASPAPALIPETPPSSCTSATATVEARSVLPIPIRQTSTYDQVVSTLSAIRPLATTSTRNVSEWSTKAARRFSTGFLARTAGSASGTTSVPAPDVDVGTDCGLGLGDDGGDSGDELEAGPNTASTASNNVNQEEDQSAVIWSTWCTVDSRADSARTERRLLIQVNRAGGVIVWDGSSLQEIVEVLRLPAQAYGGVLQAMVLPEVSEQHGVLLAILTHFGSLVIYSLSSHKVVQELHFPRTSGRPASIAVSSRFIAVGHHSPPSLSILLLPTFDEALFSPLREEVAVSSSTKHPVFALSRSGRMLAYSSASATRDGTSGIISASAGHAASASRSTTPTERGGSFIQAGQYAGTARKLGEGVVSGVAALSEYGYSTYTSYQQQRQAQGKDAQSLLSRSAPQQGSGRGHLLREPPVPAASAGAQRGATTVVVVDLQASCRQPRQFGARARTAPVARPPTLALQPSPDLKVVAHFRPSRSHPIVLVSFSPSGTQLLTASSEGNAFNVFELRPPSPMTALQPEPASQHQRTVPKVWHRYRLQRGLTPARAVSCAWSADGRLVGVTTAGKGTCHIFAILPQGGPSDTGTHVACGERIANETQLAPLSTTLNSIRRIAAPVLGWAEKAANEEERIARCRRITSPSGGQSDELPPAITPHRHPLPPAILFLPARDVSSSFAYAAHTASSGAASSAASLSSSASREVHMALAYQHTNELALSTLILSATSAASPAGVVNAAAPIASRAASSAMSGLSQMMSMSSAAGRAGYTAGAVSAPAAHEQTENPPVSARQEWRAYWPLRGDAAADMAGLVQGKLHGARTPGDGPNRKLAGTSPHQAEIQTHSQQPGILPKSVYLSALFQYSVYPPRSASLHKTGRSTDQARAHPLVAEAFAKGDLSLAGVGLRKVIVREEVAHRHPGGGSVESESGELHSAMTTILDSQSRNAHMRPDDMSGEPGKAHLLPPAPAFPNGYGRSSSTASSLSNPGSTSWGPLASLPIPIPIRGAARNALAGLRSPRLGRSNDALGAETQRLPPSLSFEDDDAVLTSRPPAIDEEEPVDLFSGYQAARRPAQPSRSANQQQQPRQEPRPVSLPLSAHARTRTHTPSPSSLGRIPELSVNGESGSSAEEEHSLSVGSSHGHGHGRMAASREVGIAYEQAGAGLVGMRGADMTLEIGAGKGDEDNSITRQLGTTLGEVEGGPAEEEEEEGLGWKLDGVDDEQEDPALPLPLPTATENRGRIIAPAVPTADLLLLSPPSSSAPSPAHPDVLAASPTPSTASNSKRKKNKRR